MEIKYKRWEIKTVSSFKWHIGCMWKTLLSIRQQNLSNRYEMGEEVGQEKWYPTLPVIEGMEEDHKHLGNRDWGNDEEKRNK